jgi:protein arginine kinase activator
MPENLKCCHCGEPATVHLTQIVNSKIIKVDLCEACAQEKGVTDPEGFSLADLLAKSDFTPADHGAQTSCPGCGLTTADFRRTGRLGCATCYEIFDDLLRPALEDMHAGNTHSGKVPQLALNRQYSEAELAALEHSLKEAIEREDYEAAARMRDQIQEIKEESGETVRR